MYADEFWRRNVSQHLKFLFLMVRTHTMKNSSNTNYLKKQHFCFFLEFDLSHKVILRGTQRKNYHLKVLPINSWGFLDVFCTMNEYTTTLRSKNTSCQSTLILLENLHTHHIIQNSIISKQNERTLTGCIF